MSTGSVTAVGQQNLQNATGHDVFKDLDLQGFLKLLIAELSNQDPMNPMDNQQILQQVGQIREIESNQRLTTTLASVLLGQNVATASGLLGRSVVAMTDQGDQVTGHVDRVSIENSQIKLHVGDQTIGLKNLAEILPQEATAAK